MLGFFATTKSARRRHEDLGGEGDRRSRRLDPIRQTVPNRGNCQIRSQLLQLTQFLECDSSLCILRAVTLWHPHPPVHRPPANPALVLEAVAMNDAIPAPRAVGHPLACRRSLSRPLADFCEFGDARPTRRGFAGAIADFDDIPETDLKSRWDVEDSAIALLIRSTAAIDSDRSRAPIADL
jgi:hypothetical protein